MESYLSFSESGVDTCDCFTLSNAEPEPRAVVFSGSLFFFCCCAGDASGVLDDGFTSGVAEDGDL